MNTSPTCPQCGAALPADAPEALCPACLFAAAETVQAATLPSDAPTMPMPVSAEQKIAAPFAVPALEELAGYFPQLEILELLGRGGMGAVYKARQKNLNRLVALKILTIDPAEEGAFGDRFQREAQALAKLNHPNIVTVHDFGVTEGLYYFVMEYVDGANLRTLIRSGELKPEAALALIPSFCDALQYAHDEGVVHRDIKPENVLVDKKGRIKIADFGLAKLLGQESTDDKLTRTGMTFGTPRYMAPEQIDRPETVDHRADIYSLGVVFYEMLTGEVPMGHFALPSEKVQVDVKLDEIVLRSLERDVERRYQRASEIKTDVESVARHPVQPSTAETAPALSPVDDTRRKLRWAGIGLLLAGIADFGYGLYLIGENVNLLSILMKQGSPIGWQVAETFLSLGMLVAVYYIVGVAKHLMNPQEEGGVTLPLLCAAIMPPGFFIGLPAAILAFVQLNRPETKSLIQPRAPAAAPPLDRDSAHFWSTSQPAKPRTRHLLSAGLVLLCLFAFFFAFSFQAKSTMTAEGPAKTIIIGALDPLYVSETHPGGFNTNLNFFSWSFFACVVAMCSFGALWRIGREDQGKVARDPEWWRSWWKQAGIWGGIVLIACVVRTVRNPEAVFKYTPVSAKVRIAEDPSRIPATRTAGRTDYAYRFTAPANHRIIVWLEWWKGNKRTIDQDCNTAYVAERGKRVEHFLQVVFNDGDVAGPATKGQVRIDWLFDNGGGNSTSGRWRPDFFEGLATSVDLDRVKNWTPKVGETVNLLEIRGGKDSIDGNPVTEERLRAGRWEAVMILRARVEAVPESIRWEGTATQFNAWNDNEEPSPTLLRLGEAFGAVLGPFTDARNLREQIVANIRQDPALRTKAGQLLSEAGLSFTPEEKPEDLLKKLEAIPVATTPALTSVKEENVTYLEGHTSAVKAVAISPDGRTLASAGMDGRVLLWDLPDGKLRRTAVASSHPKSEPLARLRTAVISPNGERVVTGGDMRGLQSIDLITNQIVALPVESGATIDKLMSAGEHQLAYITIRDDEIVFYDTVEQRANARAPLGQGAQSHVGRAVASPDGKFFAVTTARLAPKPGDPTILQTTDPCWLTVYDTTGVERFSWQFVDTADFVSAQVIFTSPRSLAVCLPSGQMQRWTLDDAGQWQAAAEPVRIAPGRPTAAAASRDGKIIWLAEGTQIVGIDSTTGKGVAFVDLKIGERLEPTYSAFPIEQIAVTNDPMTIFAALWDGKVALAKCWLLGEGDATKADWKKPKNANTP